MAQYPVSSTSSMVFQQGYSATTTVRNIGAATVYLDSAITVNPGSAYPLGPGATLQWDAGRALYVCTDPGKTSTLALIENAGNLFDPVAIGDAILAGGLADQIAAKIAVSGAPPIDTPTVLYNQRVLVPAGTPFTTVVKGLGRFQSVSLWVADEVNTNDARECNLWFGDSVGATFILTSSEAFGTIGQDVGAGYLGTSVTYKTAASSNDMQINLTPIAPASTVHIIVTATMKSQPKPEFVCHSQQMANNGIPGATVSGQGVEGFASIIINNPAIGTWRVWQFSGKSGPALLAVDVQGGNCQATVMAQPGTVPLTTTSAVTPAAPLLAQLVLPAKPCAVYFGPNGATFVRATLMMSI